ncbi:hypothetical protein Taro_039842, partial [Colocasia esculenta]|nr:hypothetical protein [Colocasia esculenta]
VWLAEADQLEDAEVHTLHRGIAFLLLQLLLPVVHTLLRGTTLPLLPQLLPSEFKPPEVTRWITKSLLHHLPGPVAQWRDYPRDVLDSLFQSFLSTYRFATAKQEEDARIAWEKVAGRRFSDNLTKKKELAKRAVGGVADPLQWKSHGPPAIRKDYWDAMCDQWATQEYQARRRRKAALWPTQSYSVVHINESYEQQLIEWHGDDSSQHPQFDASAWLVATGQPKKGRVFGFGTGMDASGVISSTMESGCSAASYSYTQSPPPPQQPTELPDQYYSAFIKPLDNWFDRTVSPALHAMGVSFPHPPPSTAIGEQCSSNVDGDDHETRFAED